MLPASTCGPTLSIPGCAPIKFGFALSGGRGGGARSLSLSSSPSRSPRNPLDHRTEAEVPIIYSSDSDATDRGVVLHAKSEADGQEQSALKKEEKAKLVLSNGRLDESGTPLAWAVIKAPSDLELGVAHGKRHSGFRARGRPLVDNTAGSASRAGERTVKRLRAIRHRAGAEALAPAANLVDEEAASAAIARLRERAVSLLCTALGGCDGARETAAAVTEAFLSAHALAEARRLLLALGAGLRVNDSLRCEVLRAGPFGVGVLARQDPQEWASEEIQAKRRQWAQEALQEVKPAGPIGKCPECDGRAVVACGTAGSGRSSRLTKSFYHYSCLEDTCGKDSHVKLD